MTVPLTDINWAGSYRRAGNIVSREIAGEHILVPIRGNLADLQKLFSLNQTGAYIWGLLDGEKTLGQIRDLALGSFDAPPERLEADILEFLNHLVGSGLAEPGVP